MTSSTVRAIYRCLLRDARELQRTPHFNVRRGLQLDQWGVGCFVEPLEKSEDAGPRVVKSLEEFQELRDTAFRMGSPSVNITKSIRLGFRENMQLNSPKVASAKLDEAIEALTELSEQLLLAQCSSVTVTDGVRIEATSKYLQNHSNPDSSTFRFTYRVTITNQNFGTPVHVREQEGSADRAASELAGCCCATPVLAPGQTFEYASGVDIDAPRRHGLSTCCAKNDGELFDALVSKVRSSGAAELSVSEAPLMRSPHRRTQCKQRDDLLQCCKGAGRD